MKKGTQVYRSKHDTTITKWKLKEYNRGFGLRLDVERNTVGIIDDDYYNDRRDKYRKLVASSDSAHGLPGISSAFKMEYCVSNGVGEWDVLCDINREITVSNAGFITLIKA